MSKRPRRNHAPSFKAKVALEALKEEQNSGNSILIYQNSPEWRLIIKYGVPRILTKARQIVQAVSKRKIADWYAYFIAGPVMYITVDDARPSVPEIAGATIECLQWVLNGETIVFPETLSKQLSVVFRPLR